MVVPAGEFDLIRSIRRLVKERNHGLVKGIGDDCAVLAAAPDHDLLVTTDSLIEGVHFRRNWLTPRQLGARSITINVSDIAAMGGVPRYALVSLGLPSADAGSWVENYYLGVEEACTQYKVSVIGGNLSSCPQGLAVTVVLIGQVEKGRAVYRSGGLPGDTIRVTGTVGGAAAGLTWLRRCGDRSADGEERKAVGGLLERFLSPVARVQEGRLIAQSGRCTAMIDLSDGIASDLRRICEESRVGAEIFLSALPLDSAMVTVVEQWGECPADYALYGGEDYELMFTMPAESEQELRSGWPVGAARLAPIGRLVEEERGIMLVLPDGDRVEMPPGGFDHFASSP